MKKKIETVIGIILAAMSCMALTGCAPAGAAEGGTAAGGGASGIILLVVMLVVFYFFLIRPENKKKKQAEQMRSSLSVGDKITTIGGFVGKIVDISGELITFETGEDRVRLQCTKWAVSANTIDKSGDSTNNG